MTITRQMIDLDEVKGRINMLYADTPGTESYERRLLVEEIERLRKIEAAARNLIAVKGRHHTAQAYKMLEEALK